MKKIKLVIIIVSIVSQLHGQNFKNCETFKEFYNPSIYGNERVSLAKIKQNDTIVIDEVSIYPTLIQKKVYTKQDVKPGMGGDYLIGKSNPKYKYFQKQFKRKANKTDKKKFIEGFQKEGRSVFIKDEIGDSIYLVNDSIFKISTVLVDYIGWYEIEENFIESLFIKNRPVYSNLPFTDEISLPIYDNENESKNDNQTSSIAKINKINSQISLEGKIVGNLLISGVSILNPSEILNRKLLVLGKFENWHGVLLRDLTNNKLLVFKLPSYDFNFTWPKVMVGNEGIELKMLKDNLIQTSKVYKGMTFINEDIGVNKNYEFKSTQFVEGRLYLKVDIWDNGNIISSNDSILFDSNSIYFEMDCYKKILTDYLKKEIEHRSNYLKQNFSQKEIDAIKKNEIFIGMTEKALIESKGWPFYGIYELVMNGIKIKQYNYSFSLSVIVKNGYITGWEKYSR